MKGKTQGKSQGKSQGKRKTQENHEEEDIDELIKDFTLKKPRSNYTIYISEQYKKDKDKDKDGSVTLMSTVQKYSSKWNKLNAEEKEKYISISKKEKERYETELKIVKSRLIQDHVKEGATAYYIYKTDYLKKAIENDEDPKEAKKEAKEIWGNMTNEQKREWRNKEKQNDDWWEKAKKTGKVNSYSVFVQKKLAEAKEKNINLSFSDVSDLWKKASEKEKRKMAIIAEEINQERQMKRDQYEIAQGIKPKRPGGAYRLFLQQMSREGKLNVKSPLKEGKKLWDNLDDEAKEQYFTQYHRIKLCYIYKKMKFKDSVRKKTPTRARNAYNIFVSELNYDDKPAKVTFMKYASGEWEKLSDKEKEKYAAKAKKEKEKMEEEKKDADDRIYDHPKRAKTSYQFFVSERIVELKKERPKEDATGFMPICAEEWNTMHKSNKSSYVKASEKEKKRYKEQITEFTKYGYYKKTPKQLKEESAKKETQREKRKSQRLSQSQKKNKK